jgi:acetyl-CoA carboxylase carboxyltransferase component
MARCSGVVPVVVVVSGPAVSGPALLLGLADLVVMTEEAYAFLSGPRMVEQFTGQQVDAKDLGGADTHAAASGVAAAVTADEGAALDLVAALLAHLPAHADDVPPQWDCTDPTDRLTPELVDAIPQTAMGAYDVRTVIAAVVDEGELLELWARWAPNLVTGLAAVGGRAVGVVANQPQSMAGTLDIAASQKGARFVRLCDSFGISLVTLVDTPGYFPGKDLEWRGIIRKGAQLAFAYAEATVPRVSVILRKAYGGAYIVMDSKAMGSDLCMAWPSAQVAVMGPQQAVQILHRSLDEEARAERQAEYERDFLNPWVAAERGYVDMVVEPADTRRLIAACLDQLATKRERLPRRRHSNTPL